MGLQPLPEVTDDTAAFWEGGADGHLHIYRCGACRGWFHPPAPVCPECLSLDVGAEVVSGLATVKGYTVNVQPWAPDMEVPFAVGIVSLDDAPGVQLTTRFVDVDPSAVHVGMALQVRFEQVDEVYLPLFAPVSDATEVPR